jgi:DNA-binding FrmR family transcriptional regulator
MKKVKVEQKLKVASPEVHSIHNPQVKKAVLLREAKARGHFESVIRMSELGADSEQILTQLKAVEKEIAAIAKEIKKDQASYAILRASKQGDPASIDELNELVTRWIKAN